jgi:prolipoprotein diacylglyceryl transferase
MYPDLSYILNDLIGTQPDNAFSIVKTFGLMLIVSFLVSAWFLRLELIRKEKEGLLKPSNEKITSGRPATVWELVGNGLLGFILGFKLPYIAQHFNDFQNDAAGVLLSSKGSFIWGLAGAAFLGFLKYWEHQRKRLKKPITQTIRVFPHERVPDITIVAAVSGIIGAKLFAVIESVDNFRSFLRDPLDQLLSGSGLAIYGGLIVAFISVLWYIKKKGITPIHMMDAVAPALIIGYGVGRIGCQMSGDGDWGIVNTLAQPTWWFLPDWLWAYDYPQNVLNEGIPIDDCAYKYCRRLSAPVFPTPVYEVVMSFLIAAILWILRKRVKIAGIIFFLYVLLNGVERFWIEKIRVNPDIEILGIRWTQAEYLAFLFVVIGIAGIAWSVKRSKIS